MQQSDILRQQLAEERRLTGLAALLLLVDDYAGYKQGTESALPGLWRWMDNLKEALQDGGNIKEFVQNAEACPLDLLGVIDAEAKGTAKKVVQ
ncbi:MAG: hypothetical protein ABSC17_09905 [Thermacetogeniaceae bacterium]